MHDKLDPQDHRGHDHRPWLKVDLPTHEQPSGAREGVGSLPGPNTERGVAILPDERSHAHHTDSGQGKYHFVHTVSYGKSQLMVSHPGLKTAGQKYELPTTEIPSGSSVGIGSMPGSIWESGVATLPEERINGRPYGQGHTGFEGCPILAFYIHSFIHSWLQSLWILNGRAVILSIMTVSLIVISRDA